MQRTIGAATVIWGLLAASTFAQAATQQQWDSCQKNPSWDVRIQACTQILGGKEPNNWLAIAHSERGLAYGNKGDFDQAIVDFNRAVQLDPKMSMGFNNRGWAYVHKADYDRAIADLTRAIELDGKNKHAWGNRGWAAQMKGDHDKAIADLTRSIEIDAKFPIMYMKRSISYSAKGDYDRAIADLTRSIELDPKSHVSFNDRGNAYLQKSEFDRAIADYTRAIDLSPRDPIPFSGRGYAYFLKGDYERAIIEQTHSIDINPKHYFAVANRAAAYYRKGDFERAKTELTRAIDLEPKHADAFTMRGDAFEKLNEPERAIADYSRAIEIDPRYVTAYNNRGFVLSKRGDFDRAIGDLNRAVELSPQFANPYRHRGVVYMKKGMYDMARADLNKALSLKPDYQEAKDSLAELDRTENKPTQRTTPSLIDQITSTNPNVNRPGPTPGPAPIGTTGKRVALVIGNAAYKNTPALTNPKNDASDMTAVLKRLGFQVIEYKDLDKRGMDDAFRRFARELPDAEVALFFYAGHAMQFEGVNYLMPVDAKLEHEADLPYEMAKIDDVISDMNRVRGVRIAVLDACRDNPLEAKLKRSLSMTRSGLQTRGLARLARPEGLIVAYSTQSGNVAEDGGGRNSPFTSALLQHIETPGLEVGTVFRRVMGTVKQLTAGRQHPELSILFDGEFYFKPGT